MPDSQKNDSGQNPKSGNIPSPPLPKIPSPPLPNVGATSKKSKRTVAKKPTKPAPNPDSFRLSGGAAESAQEKSSSAKPQNTAPTAKKPVKNPKEQPAISTNTAKPNPDAEKKAAPKKAAESRPFSPAAVSRAQKPANPESADGKGQIRSPHVPSQAKLRAERKDPGDIRLKKAKIFAWVSPLSIPLTALVMWIIWKPYTVAFGKFNDLIEFLLSKTSFNPRDLASGALSASAEDVAKSKGTLDIESIGQIGMIIFGVLLAFFLLIYISKGIEWLVYKVNWEKNTKKR